MTPANSIRIEFEDGTVRWAEGKDAAVLWDWLTQCEYYSIINGAAYYGPKFTEIPPGNYA